MINEKFKQLRIQLYMFRLKVRILWMNIIYGWTTEEQREECYSSGYMSVKSSSHFPLNPYKHPLLREYFEDGTAMERWSIR